MPRIGEGVLAPADGDGTTIGAVAPTPTPTPAHAARADHPGWDAVPEVVRRGHEPGTFSGTLDVRCGAGFPARVVAWACGFPPPGRDVPVRLAVTTDGAATRWERRFGAHELVTMQRTRPGGLVSERLGCIECVFRLLADEHGVSHEQVAAALCLGPVRLPLPAPLAPRIVARVAAAPAPRACHVTVGVVAPFAGLVLSYDGVVIREEPAP
jgi:hypothetical protein